VVAEGMGGDDAAGDEAAAMDRGDNTDDKAGYP